MQHCRSDGELGAVTDSRATTLRLGFSPGRTLKLTLTAHSSLSSVQARLLQGLFGGCGQNAASMPNVPQVPSNKANTPRLCSVLTLLDVLWLISLLSLDLGEPWSFLYPGASPMPGSTLRCCWLCPSPLLQTTIDPLTGAVFVCICARFAFRCHHIGEAQKRGSFYRPPVESH